MSTDEQAGQYAVHDVAVADDHAAELLVNGFVTLRKLGGTLFNRIHGFESGVRVLVVTEHASRSASSERQSQCLHIRQKCNRESAGRRSKVVIWEGFAERRTAPARLDLRRRRPI